MKIKNRKLLIVLASIISINISFSQSYTIIPGEERPYNKKAEGVIFNGYLEYDGKTLYENRAISYVAGESEMINRMDLNTISEPAKVANFKLDLEKRNILSEIELQRAVFNDQAYMITSAYLMDENKKEVYVRKVDFNNTANANGRAMLLNIACEKKNFDVNNFKAIFSPDKSKLLVLHILYKGSTGIEVTAHAFDTNTLDKIYETPLKYKLNGEDLSFGSFLISNNGDITCTPVKVKIVYMPLNPPKVDYTPLPALFRFKAKDTIPQIIDFPKECSEKPSFKLQAEGESIFAYGVCVNPKRKQADLFYAKFDPAVNKFVAFNTISSSPIARKLAETQGSYLFTSKLIITPEEVFVICHNSYDMRIMLEHGSYIEHYDKELVVARFNSKSDGIKKLSLIPKFCLYNLKDYHTCAKNGSLYIIYAEHPKNLEAYTLEKYDAKKYNKIGSYNGAVIVCTKLSTDGSMSRETLFRNKGWCLKPENLDIVLEKENTLLLHMIKGKKERFDKLILQ